MDKKKSDFDHFLTLFPEVSLPITLGEETHLAFSRNNKPFSLAVIREIIEPLENEVFDDTTEAIPCFRMPDSKDIHALVYWKASLMNYQYILVTFDKWGQLIDKKTIAGTFSDGIQLTQSVATINEQWHIYIASGQSDADKEDYEAVSSSVQRMILMKDGQIKIQE